MRDDIKINERASEYAQLLVEKLETIMDPEIGLDIYNLGLIYEMNLDEHGRCKVVLTFTGAGCGCIDSVPGEIQQKLAEIEGINRVAVEIVWSPAWQITRISRFGRIALGVNPN
ncbi:MULTISPECIES: metal-sulfur cluster assembly factor [unclassified Enterococcus]|uniref:metal-sulfur cluster assembly factor n=1 Tax=unclassified Enterococcus TaxID=2608891 RepID=UPI001557FE06|nr:MULTISPECIES: metal-sulfur cluster assembly factor [unclassified Enterococcus]MBS7578228.1 metal-sulfur cluster assembly factor [Enterococcus sp. MMGLQ5-2]MBS7585533.1 metal-sulfur cluster assembly factor [Enterococcus sp. MMGLQ5-1]NPD13392.1 metal-sulfur cluster assembly factor [Enterococcus sp. MMGLQ5-1]NPD38059.1 metal-sulfur cluster assembly factor [Enterococcus sp. MMGLQ5-2]